MAPRREAHDEFDISYQQMGFCLNALTLAFMIFAFVRWYPILYQHATASISVPCGDGPSRTTSGTAR